MFPLPLGHMRTQSGGPPWIYSTYAEADADSDNWEDGVEVTINNIDYVYLSAIKQGSYNGLIHKEPFGAGNGTVNSVSLREQIDAGDTGDQWTGWSTSYDGVEDTDWEYGSYDAVTATLKNLVSLKWIKKDAGQTNGFDYGRTFFIFDRLASGQSGSTATDLSTEVVFGRQGGDYIQFFSLGRANGTYGTNWAAEDLYGKSSTGISATSLYRIYVYMQHDQYVIWVGSNNYISKNGTPDELYFPAGMDLISLKAGANVTNCGVNTLYVSNLVAGSMWFV